MSDQAPSRREWQITVCTECGALTQDDRDYGGPFPANIDDCPMAIKCGTILPPGAYGPGVTTCAGAKPCPGERTIIVEERRT